MEKRYKDYANAIVNDMLSLRLGDALSINTEEVDFEFAKLIANTALPVTDVTVKIVVLNGGKPVQVLDFDPAPPAHMPTGYAMLRLSHESLKEAVSGHVLDMVIDPNDLITVQKLGHLAEPIVLNRRIAVPWCVAKVFDDDDLGSWKVIEQRIELGIQTQSLSARYRKESFENSDISEMIFLGEGTDFSVKVPQSSLFVGGTQVLSSGREFLSGIDFDKLSFLVDRGSATGTFRACVTVFGKTFMADCTFKDGLLVDWTHNVDLDRLLDFDENLRRVGYISMRDHEIIVFLGGALVDALGDAPESEEDIPDYFNTSLYSLACHLSYVVDVNCVSGNGIARELAKEGVFLE